MQTLDPDQAQGMFQLQLASRVSNGDIVPVTSSEVDVKEEFFLHTYWDLFDLITDFQKTRSGKLLKPC